MASRKTFATPSKEIPASPLTVATSVECNASSLSTNVSSVCIINKPCRHPWVAKPPDSPPSLEPGMRNKPWSHPAGMTPLVVSNEKVELTYGNVYNVEHIETVLSANK
jgi:hypothetical protein